jgi:hypothetical protein
MRGARERAWDFPRAPCLLHLYCLSVPLDDLLPHNPATRAHMFPSLLCPSAPSAYALDFQGRRVESSSKNMQLCPLDHRRDQVGLDVILQFVKTGKDTFALDFT